MAYKDMAEKKQNSKFDVSRFIIQLEKSYRDEEGNWQKRAVPYLPVAGRIAWMREEHKDKWGIKTEACEITQDYAIFKAFIVDETGRIISSATKKETKIGFGDFIEKAETGSVGRALALAGYGTQFAPELEEGERIVDTPMVANNKAKVYKPKVDADAGYKNSHITRKDIDPSPEMKKMIKTMLERLKDEYRIEVELEKPVDELNKGEAADLIRKLKTKGIQAKKMGLNIRKVVPTGEPPLETVEV